MELSLDLENKSFLLRKVCGVLLSTCKNVSSRHQGDSSSGKKFSKEGREGR